MLNDADPGLLEAKAPLTLSSLAFHQYAGHPGRVVSLNLITRLEVFHSYHPIIDVISMANP